jgi:isopenicillin N synthase-like dioxygenase
MTAIPNPSTGGFLLLGNHGIATAEVEEMFNLAHEFFVNTPEDKKEPWAIGSAYVGYTGPFKDRPKDDKGSMWLSGKPGFLSENPQLLPPFWRANADKVEHFKHSCYELIQRLFVCFAIAMELPDREHFAKAHPEDVGNSNRFRMIHYPPRTIAPNGTTTRMSEHSDSGSVTLLFQTCPGLEVESPAGDWILAPHIPGHILVNLGDALAFWSGGRLKATKHRVTFDGVPYDRERMTMAYFGIASPETVLEPVKKGDDKEEMKEYRANGMVLTPGITVGEYSNMIMESIYGKAVSKCGS